MLAARNRVAAVGAAIALGLLATGCASESPPRAAGEAETSTTLATLSANAETAATAIVSDDKEQTATVSEPAAPTTTVSEPAQAATVSEPAAPTTTVSEPAAPTTTVPGDSAAESPQQMPADQMVLEPMTKIAGNLAPKSVVASDTGLYFAQNMMYRHTISVFDAGKQLVKTLQDSVDLKAFGYDVPGDSYQGAPVEAAFTSDGSYVFVSNYRMYGSGYNPRAGGDICEKDRGEESFVYRIDTETLLIDRLYRAGPVPKYMAVTPDDGLLLVSNWCGFDVSVIDLRTHETLAEVEVGRYPRGIAVTSDGATAYVAVMGSTDIAVINLSAVAANGAPQDAADYPGDDEDPAEDAVAASGAPQDAADQSGVLSYLREVGDQPRHLVLSPDDEVLYLSLNGENAVVALDADTGQELMRARTGTQPRSMDISDDGTALYVVNYESDTMSKLRTSDFEILQSFDTSHHPIGITYDSFNDEVWVSAYSGVIHVYAEREPAQTEQCPPDGCGEQAGDEEPSPEPETPEAEPEPQPTPVTVSPLTTAPQQEPLTFEQALAVAERLAPDFVMPADCAPPPLNNSGKLPNATRAYRFGIHQGVDFSCPRSHPAEAILDGRVVVAVGDYQDASTADLDAVLGIAGTLRFTPPYTLVMLYGNHVVVDHGIIDGVGHLVSIYAHLDAVDDAVRIGGPVTAGQLLGRIGNSGTVPAAAGNTWSTVQLHWELHVNGQYLGAGLSRSDTRTVYAALFANAN